MTLIIEYQYFSPVILFSALYKYSHIYFDVYQHYQKAGFYNRTVLAAPPGPVNLSIPVAGGRNTRQPIGRVEIDYTQPWQQQHLKTIMNYYNRSPWFEFYRPELEELYRQQPPALAAFNRLCFTWVTGKLGVPVKMAELETGLLPAAGSEPVADWRHRILPKNYSTVHQELEVPAPPTYPQVYQERTGFLPNLSILDLLFCEGPNAGALLRQASGA